MVSTYFVWLLVPINFSTCFINHSVHELMRVPFLQLLHKTIKEYCKYIENWRQTHNHRRENNVSMITITRGTFEDSKHYSSKKTASKTIKTHCRDVKYNHIHYENRNSYCYQRERMHKLLDALFELMDSEYNDDIDD